MGNPRFKHTLNSLFYLEHKQVIGIASLQKNNVSEQANASDPYNLVTEVNNVISIKQDAAIA
jgi:hypothetical protein